MRSFVRPELILFQLGLTIVTLICEQTAVAAPETGALDSVRVNLTARSLPLRQALQDLVRQTDLQMVFTDADVSDCSVTLELDHVILRAALTALLHSTPLTYRVMQDGQVVIYRRKFNIAGYIRATETGERLPYANVEAKGTSRGTSSNVDGYFVLVNVPAGPCTLRVSYIGYQPVELPLAVSEDPETIVVEMKPRVLQGPRVDVFADNLQTIEVTHDPSQFRIAPLQIARLPAVGEVDVFRSLQLLPGIGGGSDVSTGLYVRGGTPDQNLVLFDGMTIYHVDHFFGFNSAFNTDAIKDVRVFKGGFPAKFGGRTSSIVELTGKSGSYDRLQAGANLNLLSGSGLLQLPIAGRGAWLLAVRRSYTDVIQSDLYQDVYDFITRPSRPPGTRSRGAPGGAFPNSRPTDFYYQDIISKLSFSWSGRDVLSLSFYNSGDYLDQTQRSDDPGSGSDSRGGNAHRNDSGTGDVTKWGNIGGSGKWSHVWNDRTYSGMSGAYSVYSSDSQGTFDLEESEDGTYFTTETNKVSDLSLQIENEWHASESHRIEFGGHFNRTSVIVSFSTNDTLSVLQRDDEATLAAFYLQDTWKPSAPLELTLGARSTYYALTKSNYLEPRASFRLFLNRSFSLKGAYGEYHQFVNRITNEEALNGNRDFWLLADERLAPNFAEHKILGLTYENPGYLLDMEAYHKTLDGVAEFVRRFRHAPGEPLGALFFIGDGIAKGVEFLAQKKAGRFSGWASYALSRVDYRIPGLNRGERFPADQDRRHEIKLVGNYTWRKWNFAMTWVLTSGAPYTESVSAGRYEPGDKNESRLPAYHRLNASCSRQFSFFNLNWEGGFSIFNLYDRQNVLRRDYLNNGSGSFQDITALGFTPTVTLRVDLR
jgi:hypothetical protein